jgi:general secretion pathway protein G
MRTQKKSGESFKREWISMYFTDKAPEKHGSATGNGGFTLVELLTVLAILGLLATIAMPAYENMKQKTKVANGLSDLRGVDALIAGYVVDHGNLPSLLTDLPTPVYKDPWGNSYIYYNIKNNTPPGAPYVDIDGVTPLNEDYDLYSQGRDGNSSNDLSGVLSQDDIIRVNSGSMVELGSAR